MVYYKSETLIFPSFWIFGYIDLIDFTNCFKKIAKLYLTNIFQITH